MEKFIPYEKQSKKAQKEQDSVLRTLIPFNTGTRVHKTDKHPSRARQKAMNRRDYDER
ncbi:MAG: hypothetical protein UIM53_02990 [Acutalibacteraceae bacterium]|nr:hypothetical protein [Acutalibacteraceae bacterium]